MSTHRVLQQVIEANLSLNYWGKKKKGSSTLPNCSPCGFGLEMGSALRNEAWAVSDLIHPQNHPGSTEMSLRWYELDL